MVSFTVFFLLEKLESEGTTTAPKPIVESVLTKDLLFIFTSFNLHAKSKEN
jgi:hypothetical protein